MQGYSGAVMHFILESKVAVPETARNNLQIVGPDQTKDGMKSSMSQWS